jgi:hypothetical protein
MANLSTYYPAPITAADLGLGAGSNATFGSLTANNGTLTASAPVLDLAQTWNNAAVSFVGLRFNITNTASAATSNTLVLQNNGTDVFFVRRTGGVIADSFTATSGGAFRFLANASTMFLQRDYVISWSNDPTAATGSITNDLILRRDAAATLGQRDGSNPQGYNLYNTFTSSTNHERGFLRWSSNVFQIGTEKGSGGGTARNFQILTDGNTRVTVDTSGNFGINVTAPERPFHISGSSMWARFDRVGTVGPAIMIVRQATLGNTSSAWLFGAPNTAGVSNEDFSVIDYGVSISGTVGTPRLTIAKSDGQLTVNGNLNLSTKDLVTDTTTGTKIGTGTTQKLGFFNATPAVQPAAVADATDAASTQARLNDLLARLRTLGLIAT